mgnify:CR=1 FL=1
MPEKAGEQNLSDVVFLPDTSCRDDSSVLLLPLLLFEDQLGKLIQAAAPCVPLVGRAL